MPAISKDQKRAMMQKWKASQNKKYILTKTETEKLFRYLETQFKNSPCDHTLRYTRRWLMDNVDSKKHEAILEEMYEMGGHCDCEVILNCYEKYEY